MAMGHEQMPWHERCSKLKIKLKRQPHNADFDRHPHITTPLDASVDLASNGFSVISALMAVGPIYGSFSMFNKTS
jgi:hypothetical protein